MSKNPSEPTSDQPATRQDIADSLMKHLLARRDEIAKGLRKAVGAEHTGDMKKADDDHSKPAGGALGPSYACSKCHSFQSEYAGRAPDGRNKWNCKKCGHSVVTDSAENPAAAHFRRDPEGAAQMHARSLASVRAGALARGTMKSDDAGMSDAGSGDMAMSEDKPDWAKDTGFKCSTAGCTKKYNHTHAGEKNPGREPVAVGGPVYPNAPKTNKGEACLDKGVLTAAKKIGTVAAVTAGMMGSAHASPGKPANKPAASTKAPAKAPAEKPTYLDMSGPPEKESEFPSITPKGGLGKGALMPQKAVDSAQARPGGPSTLQRIRAKVAGVNLNVGPTGAPAAHVASPMTPAPKPSLGGAVRAMSTRMAMAEVPGQRPDHIPRGRGATLESNPAPAGKPVVNSPSQAVSLRGPEADKRLADRDAKTASIVAARARKSEPVAKGRPEDLSHAADRRAGVIRDRFKAGTMQNNGWGVLGDKKHNALHSAGQRASSVASIRSGAKKRGMTTGAYSAHVNGIVEDTMNAISGGHAIKAEAAGPPAAPKVIAATKATKPKMPKAPGAAAGGGASGAAMKSEDKIKVGVSHSCDNCGKPVKDKDEILCPKCKPTKKAEPDTAGTDGSTGPKACGQDGCKLKFPHTHKK